MILSVLTVIKGGFGIDGNMSSLLGASLIDPQKICFCILGDLAFFYDMNVLGNRHVGKNIRILLVIMVMELYLENLAISAVCLGMRLQNSYRQVDILEI